MVGAVSRVPPIPRYGTVAREPAPGERQARVQDDARIDPALEAVRRARRAEMETLLASMASAPPATRAMAAHTLQEAERKLVRLKAEARVAAASGDRKAARLIARDLAVIARAIADAAQDYAVAEAQPDVVSPALARAAARMNAASPARAGEAVDAEALVGEAASAAAEVTQAASEPDGPDTARPEQAEADSGSRDVQRPADPGPAPDSAAPPASGAPRDEDILVKAHRLFEEAVDLLHAMAALISERPARAGHAEPVEPIPVWPLGTLSASVSAAWPAASHGR
ncbi:hypothetical protein SAMN05216360_111112 [Methylobacterium phyllostachyos]|uniref:Uncharacterized protein n=1 Tax=Methylobacterium phyllostachyos TaxID=582672 RepID=A0A1H0EAM4_9HYPH|nr:hypothetical protein [Methylobacterium phyllostachyos]SDN79389.1 hypothetical protein SAMN05216360_111112 [Methylobacterium phyllostachyos]